MGKTTMRLFPERPSPSGHRNSSIDEEEEEGTVTSISTFLLLYMYTVFEFARVRYGAPQGL